ncbi:MAG TPA: hypothetical protein VE174_02150 [Actinomycetota bacterium]|nr:hypothetical protein [Actinomycetota bacterium]
MKARTAMSLLLTGLLAVGLIAGPASIASGAAKKTTVVGTDAAGDWGGDPTAAPIGAALGQDLVGAEIGMADKKTINFIIKVSQLPPNGGVPELSRYVWSLTVDGDYVELDGKWTNYSRGACDPTSAQCPPPRDPGQQPFLVRANCSLVENVTTCEEVGIVQATFDAATGSITIPVPAALINAKRGSKIAPGSSDFTSGAGGTIVASPSAFLSVNNTSQLDAMPVLKTFTVR